MCLLLIFITLLSFLNASSSYISKLILLWFKRPTHTQRSLTSELLALKSDQAKISIVDNFAAHAKLQRKINKIETELKNIGSDRNTNNFFIHLGVTYGAKFILWSISLFVIIYYRYTPVYIFPEHISWYPLNSVIGYPNEEVGAVSVHFWLIITNAVFKTFVK